MHVAFCQRNVHRCDACGELVQRSEKDAHEASCGAAPVQCECGESVTKATLERHKAEACLHRMVECEFCEVGFTCVELMDHSEYCGSRTENCAACLMLVQLRNMDRHISSNCELYGVGAASAASPASGGGAAGGDGMSRLFSPDDDGGGGNAGSPGLFACHICGGDQRDFEALQTHIAQGCGQGPYHSTGGRRPAAAAVRPRRKTHRQPDSDVAAALAGVQGEPPKRQRKTGRDWDAEMAEALAGRNARRGGEGAAAARGAGAGAGAATGGGGSRNLLEAISDEESSDDEDWDPGAAKAADRAERRGAAPEVDDDLDDFGGSGSGASAAFWAPDWHSVCSVGSTRVCACLSQRMAMVVLQSKHMAVVVVAAVAAVEMTTWNWRSGSLARPQPEGQLGTGRAWKRSSRWRWQRLARRRMRLHGGKRLRRALAAPVAAAPAPAPAAEAEQGRRPSAAHEAHRRLGQRSWCSTLIRTKVMGTGRRWRNRSQWPARKGSGSKAGE